MLQLLRTACVIPELCFLKNRPHEGAVVKWLVHLALESKSAGSNPDCGKVIFSVGIILLFLLPSFFFSSLCELNSLLAHAFACCTTCYSGGKTRGITENPSNAIREANMCISLM